MRRRILPALAVLLLATSARATLIVDVDRSTFSSALLPGSYTDTFTFNGALFSSAATFSGGSPTFGFVLTVPDSLLPEAAVSQDGTSVGATYANEVLDITPTTGNIHAIGGDFFLTDYGNSFRPSAVTLIAADSLGGSVTATLTPTSPTVGAFLGFRTNGFITSLRLLAPGVDFRNRVDDLTVGQVAGGGTTNIVPEPASIAMAASSLPIGLACWMSRRRRVAAARHPSR